MAAMNPERRSLNRLDSGNLLFCVRSFDPVTLARMFILPTPPFTIRSRSCWPVLIFTGHLDQVPPTALTAAQLTMEDNDGNTPLHFAAGHGRLDQVPMSVLTPENLIIRNKEKLTVLEYAQRNGFSNQIL